MAIGVAWGFLGKLRGQVHRFSTESKMVKLKRMCATGLLYLAAIFCNTSASAGEWQTMCGRSQSENAYCRHIKGDAVLMGQQGSLNTIVFSNGDRRQYFYTGGTVENLEGLKVRQAGGAWFSANGYTEGDNRLYFQLPSGNIFMWISAYVD